MHRPTRGNCAAARLNESAMLAVEGTDVTLIHGIRYVNLALID
jgi:hypothetical protein